MGFTPNPAEAERQSSLPPPPDQSNVQPSASHSQAYGQPPVSIPRGFPPTPPTTAEVGFDDSHQSPSATSSRSSAAPVGPYYGSAQMGGTTDPQLERQLQQPASHPGHGSMAPAPESAYHNSPYPPSPTGNATYAYPPPTHAATAPPPVYYQHPLPTNFPPAPPAPASGLMDPAISNAQQQQSPTEQGASPWQHQHQHHHYISPSSSAALSGQPQDRYVCQTCSKAFSRPSSLRIHSYSHTGEKPFKCPYPGCGKAFSVRSNMKRHERGCHGGSDPGGDT
ncbi:MAG: hypothetical protein Q9170_001663 [Blastenia crenularia]